MSENDLRFALEQAKKEVGLRKTKLLEAREAANDLADRLAVMVCPYSVGDDAFYRGNRVQITRIVRGRWFGRDWLAHGKRYKKNGELYANEQELYSGLSEAEETI